eukprot:GFUD01079812.1.p1 GENE.GFUD01079812.1~~GFUD01079812.1.p1  ORF type:complete len:141 (+),score=60.84 GFUD01079812.1:56-478(+)
MASTDTACLPATSPAVSLLSQGVVNHYGVTFGCLGTSLEKLNTRQEIVTVAVQKEGMRLNEGRAKYGVEHMLTLTNIYKNKLVKAKEDMQMLTERSVKLRKRATKLQEEKQKESMDREMKRAKDRQMEKELIARPAAENA